MCASTHAAVRYICIRYMILGLIFARKNTKYHPKVVNKVHNDGEIRGGVCATSTHTLKKVPPHVLLRAVLCFRCRTARASPASEANSRCTITMAYVQMLTTPPCSPRGGRCCASSSETRYAVYHHFGFRRQMGGPSIYTGQLGRAPQGGVLISPALLGVT